LSFGGSSEVSASFCFASSVRTRHGLSHAYLLKTPLGASLHHWDSRLMHYRSVTLQGRDVYQSGVAGSDVAWIGDNPSGPAEVWVVVDANVSVERSRQLAQEVAAELGLADADVYLRSDPYLWRPDNCTAYTVPLQWRTASPRDELGVSRVTIRCGVRANAANGPCVTYRSP
jgi:hypothetical protein